MAGVAVQIARIYINTTQYTGANPTQIGCTITNKGPCLLNPSSTVAGFSFSLKDSYISAGEFNHTVRLWLPQTIALPKIAYTPSNSIWLVTSRGRVFSFQWPYPPAGQGTAGKGTPLNIVTGSMKIAYNGTSNSQTDSCHKEAPFPIASGSSGQKLYLLNPWITTNVLNQVLGGTTSLHYRLHRKHTEHSYHIQLGTDRYRYGYGARKSEACFHRRRLRGNRVGRASSTPTASAYRTTG